MKRLFDLELSRFLSRRAVRVFGMFLFLVVISAGSVTFALSNRDIEGATDRARTAAFNEHSACVREAAAAPQDAPGIDPLELCRAPERSSIVADPRFHLTALHDIFGDASAALVMLGLGLGASFIGAEWHHRTMTTLLTWESRRVRIIATKLAAAASIVFVGVIAFETLLGSALVPAAVFRGTTAGATTSWLGGLVGVALRGASLAAMGAVLGGAIATVARNSALALGISFAWFAVIENMIRGLKPQWQPWLIGDNAESFISPGAEAPRTALGGGVMLAIYVGFVVLAATQVFKRRDVA